MNALSLRQTLQKLLVHDVNTIHRLAQQMPEIIPETSQSQHALVEEPREYTYSHYHTYHENM